MISRPPALIETPGTAFVYGRVSTQEQVNSGLSLESQKAQGKAYFDLLNARRRAQGEPLLLWGCGDINDPKAGAFIDKAVSAYRTDFIKRRAGGELNLRMRAGDHIIFIKLDRGFRNPQDARAMVENWEGRGITVHFLDLGCESSTPMGKLMITMLAAIAEWESARRGERVREAKRAQEARGLVTNTSIPYGYKLLRKRAHIDDDERAVLAYIRGLREPKEGKPMSWRRIYAHFLKLRLKRGKTEWHFKSLIRAYDCAVAQNIEPVYELTR